MRYVGGVLHHSSPVATEQPLAAAASSAACRNLSLTCLTRSGGSGVRTGGSMRVACSAEAAVMECRWDDGTNAAAFVDNRRANVLTFMLYNA